MKKLDIIHGDDWSGLWVDGVLASEGHNCRIMDIAEHVPIATITEHHCSDAGLRLLEDDGGFPAKFPLAKALDIYC
jgi:hypothetical protein